MREELELLISVLGDSTSRCGKVRRRNRRRWSAGRGRGTDEADEAGGQCGEWGDEVEVKLGVRSLLLAC